MRSKFQKMSSAAVRPFLLLALFSTFTVFAYGQERGKLANVAEQAALVTEFEVNGLKVLVKRRPAAATVAGGLFIRGGARNITDKNAGIENLALAAATEAGTRFSRAELRRELARTGSGITAAAGRDYSAVTFVATRSNFDRVWELFEDIAVTPAFDPADVERTRTQILTGLREAETSPDGALQALQDRVIYAGHPYSNDVSGTIATISAATPAAVKAYHKSLMQTSRLLLVVVGDVDPVEFKKRVALTFGKLPVGTYREQPLAEITFEKPGLEIMPRALQTNYFQGIFAAPSLSNPDYYAMRVATNILKDMVYNEVRLARQLSYAPDAELNTFAANTAYIYATADDAGTAAKVMLDQVGLLRKEAVRQSYIDNMAGQFLTKYYLGQETNAAQAGELARYELLGGGWRNSFQFLNRIQEVTSADVKAAANKYMRNIRFVFVGDPKAVDRNIFVRAD